MHVFFHVGSLWIKMLQQYISKSNFLISWWQSDITTIRLLRPKMGEACACNITWRHLLTWKWSGGDKNVLLCETFQREKLKWTWETSEASLTCCLSLGSLWWPGGPGCWGLGLRTPLRMYLYPEPPSLRAHRTHSRTVETRATRQFDSGNGF